MRLIGFIILSAGVVLAFGLHVMSRKVLESSYCNSYKAVALFC
jgi:hypothetical protein